MRSKIEQFVQKKFSAAFESNDQAQPNIAKYTIFDSILKQLEQKKLTASWLTDYLANFNTRELALVFNNDPKSEEARLIVMIYQELGVIVNSTQLSNIINNKLTEEEKQALKTADYNKQADVLKINNSLSLYCYYKDRNVEKKSNITINQEKSSFFKECLDRLNQNQLTVSGLTQQLVGLNDKKRRALFHRGRSFGPSTKSGAAKQVEQLYAFLGVTLSKQDLQCIVHGGLKKKVRHGRTYADKLENTPYLQWLPRPYSKSACKALEHELKGQLGLNSLATALMTLAEAVAVDVSNKTRSNQTTTLREHLDKIIDYAPEFLMDVLVDLNRYHKQTSHYDTFITHILAIYTEVITELKTLETDSSTTLTQKERKALKQLNAFKKALLEASPDIAKAITTDSPENFFTLSPEMQRKVHQQLIDSPAHEILGSQIAERAKFTLAMACSPFDAKKPTVDPQTAYHVVYYSKEILEAKHHDNKPQLTALIDSIYRLVNRPDYYPLIHREEALGRIQGYLNSNPSAYKREFFKNLFDRILEEGLSTDVLKSSLSEAKNLKLFNISKPKSFFYEPTDCGAAACIFDLYQLAMGRALSLQEQQNLACPRQNGVSFPVPDPDDLSMFHKAQIYKKIEQSLTHPAAAMQSVLGQEILERIEALRAYGDVLTRTVHKQELAAEAEQQQSIFKQAYNHALNNLEIVRIDPQGRMLLDVSYPIKSHSKTVFCSIDMIGIQGLETAFITALKDQRDIIEYSHIITKKDSCSQMIAVNQDTLNDAVDAYASCDSRGSIISLQEEAEFHMRLISRVIENLDDQGVITPDKWNTIRVYAAKLIEFRVKYIFQGALFNAYDASTRTIDIAKLNKTLDKAREEIADFCQEALMKAIGSSDIGIGQEAFDTLYQQKIKGQLAKKQFTSTTATGEEYLRTNNRNQTVTRITATEHTAHDKQRGQAFRQVHRNRLAPNAQGQITVTPYSLSTTEARVPSIAIKEMSHEDSVKDVVNKLRENYKILQHHQVSHGPMVYNLLTSFVSKPAEWVTLGFWTSPHRINRQRLSAARILKGAHVFNREQIMAGKANSLCYVQNIPINQHGKRISYDSRDSVRREALLMSDIAILSTLSHHAAHLPPQLRDMVCDPFESMHRLYAAFLIHNDETKGTLYFNDSQQGKHAIELMKGFKSHGGYACESMPIETDEPLESLVTKALLKLITCDHKTKRSFWSTKYRSAQEDLRFGTLIQTLSIFLEPISQYGCKSGNERYVMVAGRVELLRSVGEKSYDELSIQEKAIIDTLKEFITGEISNPKTLQSALDEAYNQHNLQGSANAMSWEDQGAPSKVQATKNKNDLGEVSELNTNVAETGLRHLSQSQSSRMQSHKNVHQRTNQTIIDFFKKDNKNGSSKRRRDSSSLEKTETITLRLGKREI